MCKPQRGWSGIWISGCAQHNADRLHWPFHDSDAFSTMTGWIFLYSSHVYSRQLWISIRSLCHLPQPDLTEKAHAKVNYITCIHNINPDPVFSLSAESSGWMQLKGRSFWRAKGTLKSQRTPGQASFSQLQREGGLDFLTLWCNPGLPFNLISLFHVVQKNQASRHELCYMSPTLQ